MSGTRKGNTGDQYADPRWVSRFTVAHPTVEIVGRIRNLIVVRFRDGVIGKVVGGTPEAPTVMALDGAEFREFRSAREAGADIGIISDQPATSTVPEVPTGKRIAFAALSVAAWSGVAAIGAGLAPKHPGTGTAVSTGVATALAEAGMMVYGGNLADQGYTINRGLLYGLPLAMGATIMGSAVVGTKIAKKHKTAGAAIGAGVAAALWAAGVAIYSASATGSAPPTP